MIPCRSLVAAAVRQRVVLAAIVSVMAGLSACGAPTENTTYDPAVERYIGLWTAVRLNGAPLPYPPPTTRPYTQVIGIMLSVGQFQFTFSESALQFDAGTGAGTTTGCITSRRIRASATELTGTDVISDTPNCPTPLALNFALVGDSLVGSYRGQRVVFMR